MRKFRAIISMLLAFVLVVSVITIAVVSTGVVSAASAAPSLSLSNKYNGIRGKWTAVSGASHYIVYFRHASETQWSSDIAYSNYYPLLDTEPGTLYCMQVQGVAADGTVGSYSRVKSLTFIPRADIKSLYYNVGNRIVWDAVEGANRYMIARKTSVDSTYTYYTTEQTSFTEMSIAPDITYTYQVRTAYATEHNGTAYGAWSTSRSVSASAKPELTVSNKTGGVDVNWEPVAGATRYTLYYKETGTADWSSLELRDTGYLFMELTPGVNFPAPCAQRSEQSVFRCEQDHLCAAVPNGGQPFQSNIVQEYPCRMGSGHRGDAVHGLFQIGVVCFLAQRHHR